MGNFNFYINVDQCLNMSNYDMFFYKLQSQRKFHLTNVQWSKESGEESLNAAFHSIRSYMDRSPFAIKDYRLIFGMRQVREQNPTWKESVLYQELRIYYALQDQRIFIRSREKADKNVSLIMLYDSDLRHNLPPLVSEGDLLVDDLEILMRLVGINWKERPSDEEITDKIREFLKSSEIEAREGNIPPLDEVTRRFLEDFVKFQDRLNHSAIDDRSIVISKPYDYDDEDVEKEAFDEDIDWDDIHTDQETKRIFAETILNCVITYTRNCIGSYCVFRKELDRNNLSENMLALLSIVDYITMDLETDEQDNSETLKHRSEENWRKINNETGVHQRYGQMISNYQESLETALRDMHHRITQFTTGAKAPEYKEPAHIGGDRDLKRSDYSKDAFDQVLNRYRKDSAHNSRVESGWKAAYEELKQKINDMELELELFARDLSKKYKEQMDEREKAKTNHRDDRNYEQDDVEDKLFIAGKGKENILADLRRPQMTPSLQFQDQLNLENTLEQCNLDIKFLASCQRKVQAVSFLILIGICIFLVSGHHLLLQTQILQDVSRLGIYFMYIAATLFFYVLCWRAPYHYFHNKIKEKLDDLEEKMHIFIRGYYDKADNFEQYINSINQLDAISDYIQRLEGIQARSNRNSREYLWHKVQIQEHIAKCAYFSDLVGALELERGHLSADDIKLDINSGIIANPLYWPQKGIKYNYD